MTLLSEIKSTDRQIDQLVYKLCALTGIRVLT